MAIKTLQATVDKYKASTAAGQQAYTDGVATCDIDVVGRAIANQSALLANFNARVQDGTWARRLGAVGTQGWKQAVADKGGPAWQNGVTAAVPKFQQKMQAVLQVETGLQQQIQGMPSGTPAASDARMLAWSNGMRQAKANGAFG